MKTAFSQTGFFWNGRWLRAALVFLLGRRHAEPLDQVTELDPKRRWLGYLALTVFTLTFIPGPLPWLFEKYLTHLDCWEICICSGSLAFNKRK